MKKHFYIISLALLSTSAMIPAFVKAEQHVYYVSTTGDDTHEGTEEAPFRTIGKAIGKVTTTDTTTIYLEAGATFTATNLNTQTTRAHLNIIGNNTTVDAGNRNERIFRTEAASLTLKGITFSNVKDYMNIGGVLYFAGNANDASTLTIDSCTFENNSLQDANDAPGGVVIATGNNVIDIKISNTIFRNNSLGRTGSDATGVIMHYQGKNGKVEISNCLFEGNKTTSTTGALTIGLSTAASNSQITMTNNTFYNNSTRNTNTVGSVANIMIQGTSNVAAVVNNTFFFNQRDDADGETEDQASIKKIYKRTSAVNIVNAGNNTLHFVNNVVSGMRNAVISAGTNDRTIECFNNYAAVLEPHAYVSEFANGINGNIAFTARPSNAGDPFTADIAALDSIMSNVGLDSTLTEDSYIPYLAITESTSQLINNGLDLYLVNEANVIPAIDINGTTRTNPDMGAFEYEQEEDGGNVSTAIESTNHQDDMVNICNLPSELMIENFSGQPLQLQIVLIDGRSIAQMTINECATISKSTLPQGVVVLLMNDGTKTTTKKIIL